MSLDDEITMKVNQEYDNLKRIIDDQKDRAHNIIQHLESVKQY